ncbi:MAG TPA: sugar phosphate isomerase/epimerase [Steroidobacteraceae bacterium]|nr:sugar phosphate isomerase/epimerase [Steroidobacteraceae bacterium]
MKAEAEKDLEGTLQQLYAIGFREIEFAGFYNRSAADLGKLMKGIGFTLVSTHHGADAIAADGEQIIADAKTLGLEYIICSSPMSDAAKAKLEWSKKMDALDPGDWKMNAKLFNEFGRKVKDAGLTFGYHNHHVEFKKFGDQTAFDTLFGATDPELVKIELDVGWAVAARQDPLAILDEYKNRVVALHVKDIGKLADDPHQATTVAVGEGTIDWKKVIGAAHAHGVRHYFYEQEEPYTRPVLQSAKMSADYLSKLEV